MKKALCLFSTLLFTVLVSGQTAPAAAAPLPLGKVLDRTLTSMERQLVPLAEVMPADKYSFAPKGGEFEGVRTFSQQVSHLAATIYAVSAAALGEKNPSEMGPAENGPATLKTKEDVVKYLKDSLAYGHKAMAALTDQNLSELAPSPFSPNRVSKLALVNETIWHSFNHYGQMVVYARMNGVVPPASRR